MFLGFRVGEEYSGEEEESFYLDRLGLRFFGVLRVVFVFLRFLVGFV